MTKRGKTRIPCEARETDAMPNVGKHQLDAKRGKKNPMPNAENKTLFKYFNMLSAQKHESDAKRGKTLDPRSEDGKKLIRCETWESRSNEKRGSNGRFK